MSSAATSAVRSESSATSATSPAASPSAPAGSVTSGGAAAPTSERDAGPEQALAVNCADQPTPPATDWPKLADQSAALHGVSALPLIWGDRICIGWPAQAAAPSHGPWDAATAAPILVVGNTQDPSTPYANSQAMASILHDATLLTVGGYGHTELLNPSSCASGHITNYLIDGKLPADGTSCQQDQQPFAAAR